MWHFRDCHISVDRRLELKCRSEAVPIHLKEVFDIVAEFRDRGIRDYAKDSGITACREKTKSDRIRDRKR